MGTVSNVNVEEVPGGLFTLDHWIKVAADLADALKKEDPVTWRVKIKPQSKQWVEEYSEYIEKQKRVAKERALAKLTLDDKIALGLEK